MKNYICFVNDHSGSMYNVANAAINDYNSIIESVKNAATREMQDTIVNTVGFGLGTGRIERQVVNSNPHVLKPIFHWASQGNTPLYDAIGNAVALLSSVPDYDNHDVSFLVSVTTDGEENCSVKHNVYSIKQLIKNLQETGRWTFVIRVPNGYKKHVMNIGIPEGNIQEWNTTSAGMKEVTAKTQAAVDSYFTARSAGSRSSTTFYADATKVDTSSLVDITKDVSLYIVPDHEMGIEIREFILKHRMEYLKGAAFYQLTKTEPRVQHDKLIAVRARSTGKFYIGKDARKMIGLPVDKNARLHPGDHGNFDIFIQSSSVNRKLVAGTGVMYYDKIGVPFTEMDFDYLKPKKVDDPVVQLPKVEPTNKPTPNPASNSFNAKKMEASAVNGILVKFFATRKEAREYDAKNRVGVKDLRNYPLARANVITGNVNNYRWFVYV